MFKRFCQSEDSRGTPVVAQGSSLANGQAPLFDKSFRRPDDENGLVCFALAGLVQTLNLLNIGID